MILKPAPRRGLSQPAVQKLHELSSLLVRHDRQCWAIGDLVAHLLDHHRVPLSVIAAKVHYSKARLSELSVTARMFPPEKRTANFHDCLMARYVFTRFVGLNLSLEQIRDEIAQMHGKRSSVIKAHFATMQIAIAAQRARSNAPSAQAETASASFHADWRNVVPNLPDHSVKMFHADPPYGGYGWTDDGGYMSSRAVSSGLRTDSDANTSAEAMAVTLALFELCLPKLQEGGCLLLWQPGARPDSPLILEKAKEAGWDFPFALTWLKSNTGVAAEDCPYVSASERLLIFVPRGTKLTKHERNLSRSDVLAFPSETIDASRQMRMGKSPFHSTHMFQKPVPLVEHLIRKHSYAGELVVDLFGCSGSACIAAERLGRRWVYIESNQANYEWGISRIAAGKSETYAVTG